VAVRERENGPAAAEPSTYPHDHHNQPHHRALAQLEDEEGLYLTPFERNLEVWRQLWRVLERSDIVVQVVDARDPLTYWSDSLAAYASDIHSTKTSFVLLNKADLLPAAVRRAWADWFDAKGQRYVFWSAAAAADAQQQARHEASVLGLPAPAPMAEQRAAAGVGSIKGKGGGGEDERGAGDERIRVLGVEELLEVLEQAARDAVEAGEEDDPRRCVFWAGGLVGALVRCSVDGSVDAGITMQQPRDFARRPMNQPKPNQPRYQCTQG